MAPETEQDLRQRIRDLEARLGAAEQTPRALRSGEAERTIAAWKELAQFASIISHDLRSPLSAITSFAEQLREEYQDKLGWSGMAGASGWSRRPAKDRVSALLCRRRALEERKCHSVGCEFWWSTTMRHCAF
jgi:signal transduction histidine kinase